MRKRGYMRAAVLTLRHKQGPGGGGDQGGLNIKLTCGLFLKLKRVPSVKLQKRNKIRKRFPWRWVKNA